MGHGGHRAAARGQYAPEYLRVVLRRAARDPIVAQLIVAGMTDRVVPAGPFPRHPAASYTPSHWASTESFLQLVAFIDGRVNQTTLGKR